MPGSVATHRFHLDVRDGALVVVLPGGARRPLPGAEPRRYEVAGPNWSGDRASWSEAALLEEPARLLVQLRTVHEHEGGVGYGEDTATWTSADGGQTWTRDDSAPPESPRSAPVALLSTHPGRRLGPHAWGSVDPSLLVPREGRLLDRYRTGERLAERGSGDVWAAVDEHDHDRPVMVKVLALGDDADTARARLSRTRAALLGLAHPSIPRVLAIDETAEGGPVFVSELPAPVRDGRTLASIVEAEGSFAPGRACALARALLAPLAAAHRVGIAHGALRPDDVFVGYEAGGELFVIDLGVAWVIDDPKRTRSGVDLAELRWLAPERLRGAPPDALADVYGVGLLLWWMLAGVRPFRQRHVAALLADISLHGPPPLPASGLSPQLVELVARATAVDRTARHPSADAFAGALATVTVL